MYKKWVLAMFLSSALSFPAMGEEETATTDNNEKSSSSLTSELYKLKEEKISNDAEASDNLGEMLFGLMAVLGLIALLAWSTKRLKLSGITAGQGLKLQSVLPVGSKEKLVVVEVENKRLVLGVTSQAINLICELDKDTDKNKEAIAEHMEDQSFAQQIKHVLKQGKLSEDTKAS